MSDKNDKTILDLKAKIKEKRTLLKTSEKFSPVTNCSIELDGTRYNLHVSEKPYLIMLGAKLLAIVNFAKEYGCMPLIGGYSAEEWLLDVRNRLAFLDRAHEEEKLAAMEKQLERLLSSEKRVELELEELAKKLS